MGLAFIASFFIYWLFGSILFGLDITPSGRLDLEVLKDSALLAVDKTFPFGASVDEAKLFNEAMIGKKAGLAGAIFGFIGAIQTVFSGVMIFLLGLAVRSKLLIG